MNFVQKSRNSTDAFLFFLWGSGCRTDIGEEMFEPEKCSFIQRDFESRDCVVQEILRP
jgi:hypothetical protein